MSESGSGVSERRPAGSIWWAVVLDRCEYPLIVWTPHEGTINLASDAAAELFNVPLERLVGGKGFDYVESRGATERAARILASGEADSLSGSRPLRREALGEIPVQFWSRVIDLGGERRIVALVLPKHEVVEKLGPDPAAPWRELMPIALGLADAQGRIVEVSADISNIVARNPDDLIGTELWHLFDPDDVAKIVNSELVPPTVHIRHVRLADYELSGDEVSVLVGPFARHATPIAFAIVGSPDGQSDLTADRILDLEMRLRRIGAEVRAAGVLDALDALPTIEDHPKLGELTTRQQEVLGMLLQGQRVAMIASQLFVSQSTVRNHLATIFNKFGVHSQAGLLELLTPRSSADPAASPLQRAGSGDGRS